MTNKDLILYGGLFALGAFAVYEITNSSPDSGGGTISEGLGQAVYFTGILGGTVAVVGLSLLFI